MPHVIRLTGPQADCDSLFSSLDLVMPTLKTTFSSCHDITITDQTIFPQAQWRFTVSGKTAFTRQDFEETYDATLIEIYDRPTHI